MRAVVERDVQRVLRAEVEQAAPNGILTNDVRVAERALGNSVHDQLPRLAVVVGLVDPGLAVVLLMRVDDDVRRSGVVA